MSPSFARVPEAACPKRSSFPFFDSDPLRDGSTPRPAPKFQEGDLEENVRVLACQRIQFNGCELRVDVAMQSSASIQTLYFFQEIQNQPVYPV